MVLHMRRSSMGRSRCDRSDMVAHSTFHGLCTVGVHESDLTPSTDNMAELVCLLSIVEGTADGTLHLHCSAGIHEECAAAGAMKLCHGFLIHGRRDRGDVRTPSAPYILCSLQRMSNR